MKQSKRYLVQILGERGIMASRRLGQCFLVDGNLLGIMADAADLGPADFVLEVGTGTGQLTEMLAADSGTVLTVEIDRELCAIARENLEGLGNVEIINADALDGKRRINPLIESRIEEAAGSCGALKMVSNLPYNIALPVIQNLLEGRARWERMVVTVQKEFAEKMTACPGSQSYGAFSVAFQARASAEVFRALKPSVFWPRPNVDSAMVVVTPHAALFEGVESGLFREVVAAAFSQRRKKLANSLRDWLSGMGLDAVDLLIEAGVDPFLRPGDLSAEQYAAITRSLAD